LSSLAIRGSCIQILALACPSFLVLDMTRRGACNVHQWQDLKSAWECGCGCFLKCFSCWNISKWCFFIFKKFIFKINASKRSKTYKKFDFLWNTICTAFPNVPQSIIIRKNDWFCIWNCVWLYFKSVFNLKKTSNWIFLLFFDDFDALILKIIKYIYIMYF